MDYIECICKQILYIYIWGNEMEKTTDMQVFPRIGIREIYKLYISTQSMLHPACPQKKLRSFFCPRIYDKFLYFFFLEYMSHYPKGLVD